MLPALHLERRFLDFNCSRLLDAALGAGLRQAYLYQMVYAARQGKRLETLHFADVMRCTLRKVTFDAFERAHGPKAITYAEWFYCKLLQFLEILTYERLISEGINSDAEATDRPWEKGCYVSGSTGPEIDEEHLQQAFTPDDAETFDWQWLVQEVSTAGSDRGEVLNRIIEDLAADNAPAKSREWAKNKRRNRVIRDGLIGGKDSEEICRELDKRAIHPLPIMERYGIPTFVAALEDPRTRNAIQQMISKVGKSAKPVKS